MSQHIVMQPIEALKPYRANARTHSRKQIKQIAASIERFGFTNPILVSDDREIIAGHGRAEAAKILGIKSVPTLALSHLSAEERRAYVLADNKLALNAGWDREILALELQGLIDLDFDVSVKARNPAKKEQWLTEWHYEQRIFDLINDSMPDRYKVKLVDRSWHPDASREGKALQEYLARRKRRKKSARGA